MKVFFIVTAAAIVYLMKFKQPYNKTYDAQYDDFNMLFVVVPCLLLACIWNIDWTPFEISWAFSIYLEAVAILPQLHMLQRVASNTAEGGSVENLTAHYIFALGSYRALYVLNWIYRLSTQKEWGHYWDPIVWVSGVVQTLLYCDFFYYYIKAVRA